MNPQWKEEFAKLTPEQQRAYLASQYGEQMAKMSPEQKEQYATQVWGAKPVKQPTPIVDANGRPMLTSYGAATREGLKNVGEGIKEGLMGAVALPYIGYEALTNPKKTMEGVIGAGGTAVEGALHAAEVPEAISDLYRDIMGKPGGPEEAIRTAGEVSGHLGGQAAAIAATMGAGEAVAGSRMGQAIKEVTGDIPGVRKWGAVRDILMGREPTPEIGATEPIVVKPGFTTRDVRVGATQKIPVTPGSEAQAAAEEAEAAKAPKLVPEPRIKITDKPGTYYSETKSDIPGAIMRGEEGAFEVGRARGLTEPGTLIRPKEAEIMTEGPRERITIPDVERRVSSGVSPTGTERRLVQSPKAIEEEAMRPGLHSIGPFEDTAGARETIMRDTSMPTAPGGHAGGSAASEEELARPGSHYVVSKSGITAHGKIFDPGSTPEGATHVTYLPGEGYRINDGPDLNASQIGRLKDATGHTGELTEIK